MSMQPLADWPPEERRQIGGILTDIDDTLTMHGKLDAEVLDAVQRARRNGLRIIAVTGRPTYWTLPLLRLCGFDAVIAENGASAFWLDKQGRLQSIFYADAATRQEHRQQLQAFASVMNEHFPQVQVADDAPMRIGDLAFDIAEHIPPLSSRELAQVADLIHDYGFFATISSIHAHASLTCFSKQSMSQRILQEVFGIADEQACRSYVFIGDSANDASMFAHYPYSIGVANIRLFLDRFDAHPRYVTRQSYGAGFVEVVDALIA